MWNPLNLLEFLFYALCHQIYYNTDTHIFILSRNLSHVHMYMHTHQHGDNKLRRFNDLKLQRVFDNIITTCILNVNQ